MRWERYVRASQQTNIYQRRLVTLALRVLSQPTADVEKE